MVRQGKTKRDWCDLLCDFEWTLGDSVSGGQPDLLAWVVHRAWTTSIGWYSLALVDSSLKVSMGLIPGVFTSL